jgi:hypothetical protein
LSFTIVFSFRTTRIREEQEQRRLITSESDALKQTITELEEKLLKSALQTKRHHASFENISASMDYHNNDQIPTLMLDRSQMRKTSKASFTDSPAAILNHQHFGSGDKNNTAHTNNNLTPVHNLNSHSASKTGSGSRDHLRGSTSMSTDDYEEIIPEKLLKRIKEEEERKKASRAAGEEEPDSDSDDSEAFEFEREKEGRENSINELNKQGLFLNAQLENEIKGLAKTISDHQNETKNAQEYAATSAEKYLKLREEYELHVQRLMLKLTQEQQARNIVEDKLEDAYVSFSSFSPYLFTTLPSDFSYSFFFFLSS